MHKIYRHTSSCHPFLILLSMKKKKTTAHLINLRMTIKSLERQAKKCEKDAAAARIKVKNAYKANNLDVARVHAETSIQHTNQSRYYQMLSARLTPMVDQLKNELFGCGGGGDGDGNGDGVNGFNLNEMQEIVQNINRIEQQNKENANKLPTTQIELSPNDVDSLMQQLNDEMALEIAQRMPTTIDVSSQQAQPEPMPASTVHKYQTELEQRLANLRRRP